MFCPIHSQHQRADQPGLLRRSTRPHRDQDKAGSEQRGRDQRIGAAVRIIRVGHAIGQAGAAPEIGQIEPALQREHHVEQDQRARHGLHAEQMVEIGRAGGERGCGWPNQRAPNAPQQQGPYRAGQQNPEDRSGAGLKRLKHRAQVDLLQPVFDQRIGRREQAEEHEACGQRNDPCHQRTHAQPVRNPSFHRLQMRSNKSPAS